LVEVEHPLIQSSTCSRVTAFGRSRTLSDIVNKLKTVSEGFYFYLILSSFNKLKTISEGVLLLPNTVTLEQVEDYIRGCSTSYIVFNLLKGSIW
jgi:hypothetical protein